MQRGAGNELSDAPQEPSKLLAQQLDADEETGKQTNDTNHVPSNRELALFVVSLAANSMLFDGMEQLVNAGIAHGTEVQRTLAAFGLAVFIVRWCCGVFAVLEPVGLVLIHSRQCRAVALRAIATTASAVACTLISLAVTPFGNAIINNLHHAGAELAHETKTALLYLCLWPLFDGLHRFHRGVLLKHGKHIGRVSAASFANAGAQVVAVTVCTTLQMGSPLTLPVFAAYAGVVAEAVVLIHGYYTLVQPFLAVNCDQTLEVQQQVSEGDKNAHDEPSQAHNVDQQDSFSTLTTKSLFQFAWPLALVQLAQRATRPFVNVIVNRTDTNQGFGVAVLALVYPLAHVGYGWINNAKPLFASFAKPSELYSSSTPTMQQLKKFFFKIAISSITLQMILLWSPLKYIILKTLLGAPAELAHAASTPLFIFSFISLAVSCRTYFTSWATAAKQTSALAPSAFIRVGATVLAGILFTHLGFSGASMGITSLLVGFSFEALSVFIIISKRQAHPPSHS
eukprot:m.251545 g.251545  ORF g.251545 m.251545 type:complete len:511 (-) comp15455_c0_seq2:224-1756(-)